MVQQLIREKIYDHKNSDSLANSLRQKRNSLFKSLLTSTPGSLRILDVGGTEEYWLEIGFLDDPFLSSFIDEIVLLNVKPTEVNSPKMTSIVGDAASMNFADQEFDVIFSNSVIEHLVTLENQQRMAQEIIRIGKRYFVQTPNRYFPVEPHFVFPFFQFLPVESKVWLMTHFSLGWYNKIDDPAFALELAQEIRLLTKAEMHSLFENAKIYEEKFFGLTKSFVAYSGWDS